MLFMGLSVLKARQSGQVEAICGIKCPGSAAIRTNRCPLFFRTFSIKFIGIGLFLEGTGIYKRNVKLSKKQLALLTYLY
jgi:hypothetical protein